MTSEAVRRAAPLLAAVAVVAVVSVGAYLFRGGDGTAGGQGPEPLRIGTGGVAADRSAGSGDVTVTADLPEGPAEAPVHRLREAEPDVARLAAALGVAPDAVQTGDAVQPGSGDVLRVGGAPGSPWQFARADAYVCLDSLPGAAPDSSVASCEVPPSGRRPAPTVAPSAEEAVAAARPVLDAVGLGDAPAVVEDPQLDTRTVRVDPVVGGVPTSGVATVVTVDADGVVAASGWLGEPVEGDRYPVISARKAVDLLAAMPVPLIGCAEGAEPVPPAPICGGPREVTGASFGLSLQWEDGNRPVLVPSWLFTVTGGSAPVPVVAVAPSYLDPFGSAGDPGSGSGSGGSVPGSPGTVAPADPASPVAPRVQPSTATSRFESVAPAAGDALTVSFYGGVEDCYSYEVTATETARQVSLRLVERRHGEVCIDLAQLYERTVELAQPLGSRLVVDAETGLPLYPVRGEG